MLSVTRITSPELLCTAGGTSDLPVVGLLPLLQAAEWRPVSCQALAAAEMQAPGLMRKEAGQPELQVARPEEPVSLLPAVLQLCLLLAQLWLPEPLSSLLPPAVCCRLEGLCY
jgi:hypothetical protein